MGRDRAGSSRSASATGAGRRCHLGLRGLVREPARPPATGATGATGATAATAALRGAACRGTAQADKHEAPPGYHPGAQVGDRVRLHRRALDTADRQPVEFAGQDLVDPGQRLLAGEMADAVADADRAPHGTAQEDDDAIGNRCDDPERRDVSGYVAENPPASRAATVVAVASRSAARSATRPTSSFALASVPSPLEIRTTVSPNRPTRSLPGSMLTRMVTVNFTQVGTSRGSDDHVLRGYGEAIERDFDFYDSMFA